MALYQILECKQELYSYIKPSTMKTLLFFIFSLSTSIVLAQTVDRKEISGRIKVEANDKEGITVFNSSTNKGTVTDENGSFVIVAGLNDVIDFGALQFQDFSVTIDERVMKSGKITVILVEEVNKLDEVLILPYDLTGNLNVDLEAVRAYNVDMNKIYLGIDDLEDYEFTDDNKSKVDNPFTNREFKHGLNLINVGKLVASAFSGSKEDEPSPWTAKEMSDLALKYDANFLNEQFEIPLDKADDFFAFIEKKPVDKNLLAENNEVELLEYLNKQSQLFLIAERGKN